MRMASLARGHLRSCGVQKGCALLGASLLDHLGRRMRVEAGRNQVREILDQFVSPGLLWEETGLDLPPNLLPGPSGNEVGEVAPFDQSCHLSPRCEPLSHNEDMPGCPT